MANLVNPCVMQVMSGATSGNVNGGFFNLFNAHFPTDGVIASGTGGSPTLSSATYTFATGAAGSGGDVGAWVWLPAQTNIIAGMYKIASVSGGVATLTASIGNASIWLSNRFAPSTVAGCATTASPTGVTFGVDYSQQTTAQLTKTDLTCTAASTTVNSAAGTFTPAMVGNVAHLTALTGTGAIVGWYEIVQYTDAHNVILDRTPTNGAANITAGTYFVGGAMSMGTSDSTLFSNATNSSTAAAIIYIQGNSTYTPSGTISAFLPTTNIQWPIVIEGYNSIRGDRPTDSTRPVLAMGANVFNVGAGSGGSAVSRNIKLTGTTNGIAPLSRASHLIESYIYNNSTTASRAAVTTSFASVIRSNEIISLRGPAISASISSNSNFMATDNYIHDSDVGIVGGGSSINYIIENNIFACNVSDAINISTAIAAQSLLSIQKNTLYGAENKLGIGVNLITGSTSAIVRNNIIYGFTTGVNEADTTSLAGQYNDYFNNTTDVTNFLKTSSDIAVNPAFANVAQITGTTATTTAGNHLVQSGATFVTSGVTAGRDFLYLVSGTGITAGVYGIASVDSETQITTDVTLAADATADKHWQITTGRNFAVGTALKATAYPGAFPGGFTTGYMDMGAVQRQEPNSAEILQSSIITGVGVI